MKTFQNKNGTNVGLKNNSKTYRIFCKNQQKVNCTYIKLCWTCKFMIQLYACTKAWQYKPPVKPQYKFMITQ